MAAPSRSTKRRIASARAVATADRAATKNTQSNRHRSRPRTAAVSAALDRPSRESRGGELLKSDGQFHERKTIHNFASPPPPQHRAAPDPPDARHRAATHLESRRSAPHPCG